jgi:hypothetical protein
MGISAIFGLLVSLCKLFRLLDWGPLNTHRASSPASVLMPLNHLASKFVVEAQDSLMKARDERTALMNEILQGIRMLKVCCIGYPPSLTQGTDKLSFAVHELGAPVRKESFERSRQGALLAEVNQLIRLSHSPSCLD